jgi:hypothetical protein
MSDVRDPQDVAESLDPDELPEYDDPTGNLQYPPDRPTGVNQYGVTAAEERVDEPLEERARREVPDEFAGIDDPDEDTLAEIEAEGLEPYPDVDVELLAAIDDEPVLPGIRSTLDDETLDDLDGSGARRLVAPGGDEPILADDEADAVAFAVEGSDLSAEEDAVHITWEP